MRHRMFLRAFLLMPILFGPLVFSADDSPKTVEAMDAAAPTDEAVLRLADTLEERFLRNELLADLAKARVFEGRVEDALTVAERVEPARDRKSLLRQLAWLAVEVRREGNPSPLFVDNAVRTKELETAVDRVLPVLDRLVAEDGTQAFLAGEIAISLLTKPRGDFDLQALMTVFHGYHGLDFNGIRIVRPFDGCCEQVLRLVDHFGKPSADASASSPSSFESNRRAYDFVVALAKAGAVEEAWSRIDSLESTEFRDWAKLAVLEAGKGWKPASQATQTGAAGIVDMEKIEEFATPEKRAWALLSLERVQRDFKIRQALLFSSSRAASDDPRLHVTHTDYTLLEQAAEIARTIEDPDHRSIQLRILAKEWLPFAKDKDDWYGSEACREQGLALLRDAETAAGATDPLFRRLELLAFVARTYRLYAPEEGRHEEIVRRIREEIDGADKRTLTVQERLHLLESLCQALGEPPGREIVALAEGNPKAAAKVGEMLLRSARLYRTKEIDAKAVKIEAERTAPQLVLPLLPGTRPNERLINRPTGEPDIDRLRLPFDVYEEYYYSPFTVEGDCGC